MTEQLSRSCLLVLFALVLFGLSACGTSSRVVLLPDADGRVGQIDVLRDGKTVSLRSAYQAADSGLLGLDQKQLTAAEVDQIYPTVRTALPKAPLRFTLFFEAGGQVLTADSQQRIAELRAALTTYAAPELLVTGHTDSVGAKEVNDGLSLKRAAAVRELLVSEGFDASRIDIAGRGEREPLVATDDEVDEPRNRRVEVKLR